MVTWLDYLEEQVRQGLSLNYFRQKRGYSLLEKGGLFMVRQGSSKVDNKTFSVFSEAYDWLLNGEPIKQKGG